MLATLNQLTFFDTIGIAKKPIVRLFLVKHLLKLSTGRVGVFYTEVNLSFSVEAKEVFGLLKRYS